MPNCYLYRGSSLQPHGDLGNGGWNTRPPKHASANPSFSALRIHSEATRLIVPDNTDLMAPLQNRRLSIGHRGRWCMSGPSPPEYTPLPSDMALP
ncbi:UNVERIFIED_CONTAM: hypothetical protein FKN15_051862 [Acipenser sinensis]